MAADYDAPRRRRNEDYDEDAALTHLGQITTQTIDVLDVDEANLGDILELPGDDLSGEVLEIRFVPKQVDEFTCSRCFLVYHRIRLAKTKGKQQICRDCI